MASRASKKRWTSEYASMVLDEADHIDLNDHAFAKRRGIHPQRLWRWRKRLGKETAAKTDASFVELTVRSPAIRGSPADTFERPSIERCAAMLEALEARRQQEERVGKRVMIDPYQAASKALAARASAVAVAAALLLSLRIVLPLEDPFSNEHIVEFEKWAVSIRGEPSGEPSKCWTMRQGSEPPVARN